MNKLVRISALLAITLSASSCLVKSIYPICVPRDSIMVPGFIGTWQDTKKEITVIIAKLSGNTYRVVYLDKENPAVFYGVVARFGGKMFMDLMPVSGDGNNTLENLSRVPAHVVFRLDAGKDRLAFSYLDQDWMKRALKGGEVKLAHETRIDGDSADKEPPAEIILTASTRGLGEFLASVAGNEKAFVKPVELRRVK